MAAVAPRVLHVSTFASGGAGRAATALHNAMLAAGIDSHLLTASGSMTRLAAMADQRTWRLQNSPVRTWRSTARWGTLTARTIGATQADIVNLHWVNDGLLSVEEIGRIEAPIVWTMHDMWPFTGTEHYTSALTASGKPRWQEGYARGNRIEGERGPDVDRWTWERKRRHWQRAPHLVPVSSWLAEQARSSALASTWPATTIPNVIDTQAFAPQDPYEARRVLGITADGPIIGFIASAGLGDERKGWQHLRAALPAVRAAHPGLRVLVIGPTGADPRTDTPVTQLGELSGEGAVATALSAMDVLAVPSVIDNLPLTACEAHACGTPVVAFHVGGLPDIVEHGSTGYLAQPFDPDDLAQGLNLAIAESSRWGQAARERAVQRWAGPAVVARYRELYGSLVP